MFTIGNSSELDIATHHISLPSPAPTYVSYVTTDSPTSTESGPVSPDKPIDEPQLLPPPSSCNPHLTTRNLAEATPRIKSRRFTPYNHQFNLRWIAKHPIFMPIAVVVAVFAVIGLAIYIAVNKSHIESHPPFTPPFASNFTPYVSGAILNPAPPPEHLVPDLYRSNWSSPNPELPKLDCDVLEPIDLRNGKGRGWTVIFIHGLGAQNASHAYQWRDVLLSTLRRPPNYQRIGNLTGVRFIFPKAPSIPITVYSEESNGGMRPGWFDIKDWRDLNYLEDEEGLRQSCIQISTLIIKQVKDSKMQIDKTIIAGFSQGQFPSTSFMKF